jgi:integrase
MSAKIFRRGKVYWFRIYRGGKDEWRSTGATDRATAQTVADAAYLAAKEAPGRGNADRVFGLLMEAIAAMPAPEQIELRRFYSRKLALLDVAPMTLDDAWKLWLKSPNKGNPSERTTLDYSIIWKKFSAWAREHNIDFIHEVMKSQVESYTADLWGRKISPATYNKSVTFLRGLFDTIKTTAGLMENPWHDIHRMEKETKSRVNFSPEELMAICHKATGAMRYLLAIGIYSGLRLADVVHLKLADIHADKLVVTPRKTARKGKVLEIPLHPVLARMLAQRRAELPKNAEYVFPDEVVEYARDAASLSKKFQTFLNDCGIKTTTAKSGHRARAVVNKSFHSLRHSFVSLCAMNRVPQAAIQDLVGHGSPAMTALYSHADFEQKSAAISKLPTMSFENGGGQ